MILADTSIWVAHFKGMPVAAPLADLLDQDAVATHPWVLGELALGGLSAADRVLFGALPAAPEVSTEDAMVLVEAAGLTGRGIGWVDVQLLAAARVAGFTLWTRDARLAAVAAELGVAA